MKAAEIDEKTFAEMEALVLETKNPRVIADFYEKTGRPQKGAATLAETFKNMIYSRKYGDALNFAKQNNLGTHCITEAATGIYEQMMTDSNHCQALQYAKEYGLGDDKIFNAAVFYFNEITTRGNYDPNPAIKLAENELASDPENLKKAVQCAFDRYLTWGDSHLRNLPGLIEKYTNFFSPAQKALTELLNKEK